MDYIKVVIDTNEEAFEILSEMLINLGAKGTQADGGSVPDVKDYDYVDENEIFAQDFSMCAYFPDDGEVAAKIKEIKDKLDEFKNGDFGFDFGELTVSTKTVNEEDWETAWKQYFKPQQVSENVVIKPTWEEYENTDNKVVIEIDPGMAFGTGTHETTRMCIELIEEFMEEGADVLDVGCGSGILSVAAAKLGAKDILALDLDPVAVKVAEENVALNNVGDKVKVIKSDITKGVEKGSKYDIVLANIIADIIIRLNEDIVDYLKKPSIYICSGIIEERLDDVLESLKENNFRIIKIVSMGEWRAVACKCK